MKRLTFALMLSLPFLASQAQAGAVLNVAEASNYRLVYSLAMPDLANFNFNAIPYAVDNHASIAAGSFTRIAYYMELQKANGSLMYAYASMDAFTSDAGKIGVPNASSGATFQQNVSNMNVFSNVAGITNGSAIATGNIDFWQYNYTPNNDSGVPGASNSAYDFGDTYYKGDGNYGSMQIHNYGAAQSILDYNSWGGGDATISDIGLGNQIDGYQLDWTFAHNSAQYIIKNLEVLVLTQAVPEPGSFTLLGLALVAFAVARRKAAK